MVTPIDISGLLVHAWPERAEGVCNLLRQMTGGRRSRRQYRVPTGLHAEEHQRTAWPPWPYAATPCRTCSPRVAWNFLARVAEWHVPRTGAVATDGIQGDCVAIAATVLAFCAATPEIASLSNNKIFTSFPYFLRCNRQGVFQVGKVGNPQWETKTSGRAEMQGIIDVVEYSVGHRSGV